MAEDPKIDKIMNQLKKQIQNNEISTEINLKNIISLAQKQYKERLSKLNPSEIDRIHQLDSIISNEEKKIISNTYDENSFDENLLQSNLSYDIQTVNKIESLRPKLIRKWVLKFRHIIQNEVRFTLNPIVDKQIKFNIYITRSVNNLKKIVDKIEIDQRKRIDEIERIANVEQRKRIDEIERIANVEQRKRIDVLSLFSAYHHYLKRDPTKSELKQWLSDDYENDPTYILLSKIKSSGESKNMLELTENFDSLINIKINERLEFKETFLKEKQSNKKHAISLIDFKKILKTNTNPFSERHTEYLWALKNIPIEGTLLDVGSLDSELANELSKIKKLKVFGIDIRDPKEQQQYNFSKEDCMHLSFQNDFFDFITIISSIEHFGLDFYGSKSIDNADKSAMVEIKRVLKPEGLLFLTIPFGKYSKSWSRVYNITSLNRLLEHFEILEEKYFEQTYDGWEETTKENAELNEGAIFRSEEESSGAIACILAKLNK